MHFLGAKPQRLGIVSVLYDQYTASHLTEALFNTYSLEKGKKNQFQSIDSFVVEWDIKVERIKRIPFVAVPEGDGANKTDVIFHFPENYYQMNDTFIVDKTRQQFIVVNRPQRVRDNDFLVIAKILDDDYSSVVDLSGCQIGDTTRFVTNYQPELHEEGYVKYQSNVEKHRTRKNFDLCPLPVMVLNKFLLMLEAPRGNQQPKNRECKQRSCNTKKRFND